MRKITRFLVVLVSILMIFTCSVHMVIAESFDVDAKSAVLVDASTGTVIYEKNAHEQLPPASVTKIMTMLLVMEAIESGKITLKDEVSISDHASSMGGSQLYLEPGEVKTVEQLMKGIAVSSANDACVAIGEHIAGNEEMFVQMMNKRAQELGMKNTKFMNTNGLPAEGHLTTAYDISLMSRELLKHPKIHDWLTIWMSTMKVGKKRITHLELTNTNKMIRFYPGANGIKTGFTQEAKYCLSASAKRNNFNLVAVLLGSPTSKIRFAGARKLLDYGFAAYNSVLVAQKGEVVQELPVEKGKLEKMNAVAKDEFRILTKKGTESSLKKEVKLPESIKAPVKKGDKIGEIVMKDSGGKVMGKVDIVAEVDCGKANVFNNFYRLFKKVSL